MGDLMEGGCSMADRMKLPAAGDILLVMIGVAFCGIGVGFASSAEVGLDAIGLFCDGVRNMLGLSEKNLGIASFIVNAIFILFLFFAKRKYVSFGTVIYVLLYSSCISIGNEIYRWITDGLEGLGVRILFSVLGFLLLYVGLGIYVAIDIGVDAFTGMVLYLRDVTKADLKYVKMVFDVILIILGAVMGGTLGAATFVTMLVAGPIIQWLSKRFQALYFRGKVKEEKRRMKEEKEKMEEKKTETQER